MVSILILCFDRSLTRSVEGSDITWLSILTLMQHLSSLSSNLSITLQKSKVYRSSTSTPSDYIRFAPSTILKQGTVAPNFTLHTTPDQTVSLKDFSNRPIILAFYPADWSPVCGDEVTLFNEILPEFEKFNAALLGISVDGVWCHLAFSKDRKLRFPLLSDFEPKGEIARKYGVYRREDGVSERALFVIDKDGIIYWSFVSPIGVNPGAQGVIKALESLDSKENEVVVMKAKRKKRMTKEEDVNGKIRTRPTGRNR